MLLIPSSTRYKEKNVFTAKRSMIKQKKEKKMVKESSPMTFMWLDHFALMLSFKERIDTGSGMLLSLSSS